VAEREPRALKGEPLARETASETDVTIVAWPHNASSAPSSSTPTLERSYQLGRSTEGSNWWRSSDERLDHAAGHRKLRCDVTAGRGRGSVGQAQTVQAYLRELVVTDFAPHVHRLRARTLLLWGACDMLFSEAARRYTVRGMTAEGRLIISQQLGRR